MSTAWAIAFWIAVVMLVDAGVALWGLNLWQRLAPGWNIRRIAQLEALAALLILLVVFLKRAG